MSHHPASSAAERLKPLAGCHDAASLKSAVQTLCAEFGTLTRIDVMTIAQAERRRALCLLRLESAAHEQQLIISLGASRFGDDILMVVDFPPS